MRAAVLLVLALACAAGEAPRMVEVAVEVRHVGLDAQNLPVVVLGERDGTRWLPIWIGSSEAHSIARALEQRSSPRPNTHDLAQRLIQDLRGTLQHVVVTDLRDGTYYATITLAADGDEIEVDSRPSDAIALALRAGAPIFVRERLLSVGGGPSKEQSPTERPI